MPPKASKRKAANGYRLPDPIPPGEVVTGLKKNSWRVGKSIGVGGFGEIYLCSPDVTRNVGDDATLAMKIEPHENGPLFVEMNFYIRAAQPEDVEEFRRRKNLKSLGMPVHCGSGSHVFKGEKYRFLIMERFGKDLQKIFQTGKKRFPPKAAFNIAIKVMDTLEYVHGRGYVHNDIKGQNLLLGHGRSKENDVYLVDFGLVSKYQRDGVHLEYKPDARKAHDGTIEYTSRDAHIGAHSRRSDLEILGFNLVHWMSGTLPWMDNLTNPKYVHLQKQGFMNDIPAFLQRCFGDADYPGVLEEFLIYVSKLEFDTEPDYDKCRDMFRKAMKKLKIPLDGKLDFSTPKSPAAAKKKKKRKRSDLEDLEFVQDPVCRKSARQMMKVAAGGLPHPTPAASPSPPPPDEGEVDTENLYTANAAALTSDMNKWSWERVLCSDPELLIRQASRQSETEDEGPLALQHRQADERKQKESLLNPTPAMLAIMGRIERRERDREAMTWHQQLQHLQGRKPKAPTWDLTPNPLTPAMEEVIKMRSRRVSVEIDVPITPDPSGSEDSDSDSSTEGSGPRKRFVRNYDSSDDEDDELREAVVRIPETPRKKHRDMTSRERELDIQFDNLLASPSRPLPCPGENGGKDGSGGLLSSFLNKVPESPQKPKGKIREKFVLTNGKEVSSQCKTKRMSSIPEHVFIETTRDSSSYETDDGDRKAKTAVRKKRRGKMTDKNKNVAAKKRTTRSTSRETRANDWNWADVLLSHPEKRTRKKRKI